MRFSSIQMLGRVLQQVLALPGIGSFATLSAAPKATLSWGLYSKHCDSFHFQISWCCYWHGRMTSGASPV